MKKSHVLAAAIITIAAPLVGITSAEAGTADKAQAQVLGQIVTHDDGTASVTARYVCPDGFHLWVSAKQVEDRTPDARLQEEGSSEVSAAWWQSHPQDFTCDGRWHTDTFTIGTFEYGFGELEHGQSWVQFCLIGEGVFISESRWVEVR